MMKRRNYNLFVSINTLLLLLLVMMACSSPSSKKKETVDMIFPKAVYVSSTDSLPFTFDLSKQAKLTWQKNKPGEYFCNVDYPFLNARLYCTYHAITPDKFRNFAEESHKMAYQHTAVATGITEKVYSNDMSHVYGILYDIQGNVATPIQVALTDSNRYFFNASLYFNITPNADSIAPAVKYIRKDIVRIMESFKVKSK
jgi:gliding motility-associated lipoprotein GldD